MEQPSLTWHIVVDSAAITALGPLSYSLMQVLWERGPLPLRGLHRAILLAGGSQAPTTIATTLYRLIERGFVVRARPGVFAATLTEAELRAGLVALIVGHLVRDYPAETRAALAAAGWPVTTEED
jgi:predicted transcriptional regulator